jgi:hypothetical protein
MTGLELIDDLLARLGDDITQPQHTYYTRGEVLVALNQVYRLFCFLTLCLETQVTYPLPAATPFSKMLLTYGDWILPLRIRLTGGAKLRPSRLTDIAALDQGWSTTVGTPERYALLGFDLLCMYKSPAAPTNIDIVYAQVPVPLTDDASNSPLLPVEYHQSLIQGATPLLRVKEGAQEWKKTLPLWDRYWDAAKELAAQVRARNQEKGYDRYPLELQRFDRSKLLAMTKGGRSA